MSYRIVFVATLALFFLSAAFDAEAGRRSLRIDFGDWTQSFELGTANCPGSAPGSPSVFWSGIQFSGGSSGTYSVDEYCQQALEFDPKNPGDPFFNENSLFSPGDEGLADKVGPNNSSTPSNNVTANRFTFLDRGRFETDPPPTGYQWEFYFFPGNITLVRLNGEIPVPGPDFSPFIDDDGELIFDGELSGYDGDYWCFSNGVFAGTWDGEPAGSAPLAGCGFPSGCYDLFFEIEGEGEFPVATPSGSPGCPGGQYTPGDLITLRAQPAPGSKVNGWGGTNDDVSFGLENELTFPSLGRGGGKESWWVTVFYEDALFCPEGTLEQTWLSEDMEDGAGGWTHSATLGSDTWVLQGVHHVSPMNAWNGQAVNTASDQRLVSPAVVIPEFITFARLSFYNRREFEMEGLQCYDGAILEYSTNGGTHWEWFTYDDFERDEYNGFTEWPTGYPGRPEQDGWCGQNLWTLAEVDVSHLAGKTVNFRFRIGTDNLSPATGGWWIDDVQVAGCFNADVLFGNNFEAP